MGNQDTIPAMGGRPGGLDFGPSPLGRPSGLPGVDRPEDTFSGLMQGGWDGGDPFAGGGAGGFNSFPGGGGVGGGNLFPGGGAGGGDVVATFAEDALGDFSGNGAAPTDIGTLALGTTVVTATQQGDPRDIDYVTFTVPEGMQLSGLTGVAYEAAPGNLAFLGIERGAVAVTDPAAADASTLLGGLAYGHYVVSVDILDIVGSLSGAQGFDGPLGPGEYTLWLNQTGPTSTVSLGLELTEAGADQSDPPGGDGIDPSTAVSPFGVGQPGGALAGLPNDVVLA